MTIEQLKIQKAYILFRMIAVLLFFGGLGLLVVWAENDVQPRVSETSVEQGAPQVPQITVFPESALDDRYLGSTKSAMPHFPRSKPFFYSLEDPRKLAVPSATPNL